MNKMEKMNKRIQEHLENVAKTESTEEWLKKLEYCIEQQKPLLTSREEILNTFKDYIPYKVITLRANNKETEPTKGMGYIKYRIDDEEVFLRTYFPEVTQ